MYLSTRILCTHTCATAADEKGRVSMAHLAKSCSRITASSSTTSQRTLGTWARATSRGEIVATVGGKDRAGRRKPVALTPAEALAVLDDAVVLPRDATLLSLN